MLLLSVTLITYLALSNSQLDDEEFGGYAHARHAREFSPFHWIQRRMDKATADANKSKPSWLNPFSYLPLTSGITAVESKVLLNWEDISKAQKCRYMIDAIYRTNGDWSNSRITEFSGQDLDDVLISLLGERLRLFNYCFASTEKTTIQQVLDVKSVLNPSDSLGISPNDFLRRMFPFLRDVNASDEPLWPIITDLKTGLKLAIPEVPADFNENFWFYWREYSQGRGIVITLAESTKTLFFNQLKVLDYMKNKLPIQVVTKGTEFSAEFVEELSNVVRTSEQRVYLVDCATVLDSDFSQRFVVNVINKWLAVIFNTFEEMVLLDVDAVPFISLDVFLDDPQYKLNGMLLYKDRNMPSEHTLGYCIDMLAEVEPSYQEENLINSKLKFAINEVSFDDDSEEATVFRGFFHNKFLHHVDSGLVVINKSSNLNGLLFSFMLNLDAKMRRCVYGDKEIFWLGQLFAGQSYAIYPVDGGIIGPLVEVPAEKSSTSIYQICGAQMAHSSRNDQLLWTNGGLKTCKITNSADADFQKDFDYFENRYENAENLRSIYDSSLRIEGLIIPNTSENPWMQLQECSGYIYCATALKDRDSFEETGHLITFEEETQKKLSEIAHIWNRS